MNNEPTTAMGMEMKFIELAVNYIFTVICTYAYY